jgi:cation transport ATPase
VVTLTGDRRATASAVAKKLDLDDVIAEVLPADKVSHLRRQQRGRPSGEPPTRPVV